MEPPVNRWPNGQRPGWDNLIDIAKSTVHDRVYSDPNLLYSGDAFKWVCSYCWLADALSLGWSIPDPCEWLSVRFGD